MSVVMSEVPPAVRPFMSGDAVTDRDRPIRRFSSGWKACATSIPATQFTGDFFITTEIDGSAWFAVGDFSGHGLRASIFTMMVQEELDRVIEACNCANVAEIVAALDLSIRDVIPGNRFASIVVGRAEPDGTIHLVNAGHCPPFILRADGTIEMIGANGPVVGIVPGAGWCSSSITLDHGDRLLLYTDGLLEARNDEDEDFGLERIAETASQGPGVIDRLIDAANRFSNGRREDDLTVFVLAR